MRRRRFVGLTGALMSPFRSLDKTVSIDDGNDIHQAINQALSDSGPGAVVGVEPDEYTKASGYPVTTTLAPTNENQTLVTHGSTIELADGVNKPLVDVQKDGWRHHGGIFDQNGDNQSGGRGYSIRNCHDVKVAIREVRNSFDINFAVTDGATDVDVLGVRSTRGGRITAGTATGDGFYTGNGGGEMTRNVRFKDCIASDCYRWGFAAARGAAKTRFIDCTAYGCAGGFDLENGGRISKARGVLADSTGHDGSTKKAFPAGPAIQINGNNSRLHDFTVRTPKYTGVFLGSSTYESSIESGLILAANQAGHEEHGGIVTAEFPTDRDGVTFSDIKIKNTPGYAVDIRTGAGVLDGWRLTDVMASNSGAIRIGEVGGGKILADLKGCASIGSHGHAYLFDGHDRVKLSKCSAIDYSSKPYKVDGNPPLMDGSNDPTLPVDVRNIDGPHGGYQGIHDGSGENTRGPAWFDGDDRQWRSLVDGSTIV